MVRIPEYTGEYRIVSLALDDHARDNILDDGLNCLYVTESSVALLPDGQPLTSDHSVISALLHTSNYNVYGILENGRLIQYYNDNSGDNVLFISGRCNSNCIMCPSPYSTRRDGVNSSIPDLMQVVRYIPDDTPHLTLTGGEPFMVGESIFDLFRVLQDRFKRTEFLLLTNGRIFSVESYTERFLDTMPDNCLIGIPIHGSCPQTHDQITQAPGSFLQTMTGLRRLLRRGVRIELRIVVSQLNADDIENIANMITRELPGVAHVCIMAMEMTGNAHVNRERVWISYRTAAALAERAARILMYHGIDVQLYNFPLCVVNHQLWTLCKNSISPYKIRYDAQCDACRMRPVCGGVFAGTIRMEANELQAIV